MTNMDETPIYLNMLTAITVQTVGSKEVNIRTQRQENWRIAVVLAFLVSGEN